LIVAKRHPFGQVARDPVAVAHAEARAGDEIEEIPGDVDQCHVGFDATLVVAELGVDGLAGRPRQIVGREALERSLGART
jgi:hypothetical protein